MWQTVPPASHTRWAPNDLSRHVFFAVALLAVALGSVYSDWLLRADLLIYDTHQRLQSRPAPDDVVIVAVDEYSLAQLGRWPWPRRTHAQLLDALTDAGAKAVVLDIIFAEPDLFDPDGDQLLAQAIQRNGNVILPVLFEQRYAGGQLIETLPLPDLIVAAHSLGHAHVELDADGITRSVYLKEGVGSAYWPHLSVSLLALLGPLPSLLPGDLNPSPGTVVPSVQQRDHRVMVPYTGPPGHFSQISYSTLMSDPARQKELNDKIVFIGATAFGLGDLLPTPVSALNHPMAGVEINANVFDALRQGLTIEPVSLETRLLVSALIALLPALLFPRLSPRVALLTSGALFVGTLLLSSLLLVQYQIWLPPAAPLLALVLAYPLWSWRRLEYANQFLDQELKRLREEPGLLPSQSADSETVMAFVKNIVPVKAWTLYRGRTRYITHWGRRLVLPTNPMDKQSMDMWRPVQAVKQDWWLGVAMVDGRPVEEHERALILNAVMPFIENAAPAPASIIELFEERVMQVQQAEKCIRAMRHFLDDSLNQMADGILVINTLGQLIFVNAKALSYLNIDAHPQTLRETPVMPLFDAISIDGADLWPQLFSRALLHASPTQTNGRTSAGLDLLIQLTPLCLEQQHINGVIINLSDISHIRANERQRLETFGFLSHDLRAPLTSMLALVDMAKDREENSVCEEFLERIDMYAKRTLNLTEDFLQVSQLEHAVDLKFEVVDIGTIVANAIDAVWDHSSKKNIRIVDNIPEEPVYVKGDPSLLERALLNLLNNAIKYSDENTRVNVAIRLENGRVACSVQDEGFGIPETALDKIFDRHFRFASHNHADIPGSGLGLSFVKSVMEKHNASIDVKSKEGEGSTFSIRLPLA